MSLQKHELLAVEDIVEKTRTPAQQLQQKQQSNRNIHKDPHVEVISRIDAIVNGKRKFQRIVLRWH